MFGLSGFFNNIQNSFTKEVVLRTTIKDSIKKFTNIDIKIENIVYKNELVNLKKVNSAELSVIYIKKQKILEDLKEQTKTIIKDIR